MQKNLEMMNSWSRFALAYTQMSVAAGEVITRRGIRMAQGSVGPAEAMGMVMEKATAFALASEKAAVAAAGGGDMLKVATAALGPYGTQTRSNAQKLRR
jgi:hypothetical protein